MNKYKNRHKDKILSYNNYLANCLLWEIRLLTFFILLYSYFYRSYYNKLSFSDYSVCPNSQGLSILCSVQNGWLLRTESFSIPCPLPSSWVSPMGDRARDGKVQVERGWSSYLPAISLHGYSPKATVLTKCFLFFFSFYLFSERVSGREKER